MKVKRNRMTQICKHCPHYKIKENEVAYCLLEYRYITFFNNGIETLTNPNQPLFFTPQQLVEEMRLPDKCEYKLEHLLLNQDINSGTK